MGFGSATVALEQAIEKITANIKWMADNKDQVWKWLKEELSWTFKNDDVQMDTISFSTDRQGWTGWKQTDRNHYNQKAVP